MNNQSDLEQSIRRKVEESKEQKKPPHFTAEEWELLQQDRKLYYFMCYNIHMKPRNSRSVKEQN